jgi:peptide/nickel transport system ATP-binding protein
MAMQQPVLSVEQLYVSVQTANGWCPIVRDLSIEVSAGETLCLVGESGCGKSLTALAIMRLLPRGARIDGGRIRLGGVDLAALDEPTLRNMRGRDLAMIFQEPMTSLNPVMTIGEQIAEALLTHQKLPRSEIRARVFAMLESVRINDPERVAKLYPHEVSGGMGQRVMIAMMLIPEPDLLIADEPTSALDVSVQAQVLDIINEPIVGKGMGLILISHDLNLVASYCDRILVMYRGEVVETCKASELGLAKHPYTRGLLAAMPRIDENRDELPVLDRSAWATA